MYESLFLILMYALGRRRHMNNVLDQNGLLVDMTRTRTVGSFAAEYLFGR